MNGEFKSRLVEKIARTSEDTSFRYERPEGLFYQAGQYFHVNFAGGDGMMRKHFSFSSSPTEPFVEMTTKMTGSPFKTALDALPIGQEVTLEAPYGEFTFREGVSKYAFLSGGIGITPIRSMAKYATDEELDLDLVLLYGNRRIERIPFKDDLDRLSERNPRFRVFHVLGEPPPGWDGYTGLVRGEIVTSEVGKDSDFLFYICGPPGMVAAMRKVLSEEMEVAADRIVVEDFTGY
ncbi:MAG: FAD-dependent oxidoreductase [Actinobacteria bacterium]|nr:MAG: FAD-dependent oxidoreductase [Actinomycetota bacterium]